MIVNNDRKYLLDKDFDINSLIRQLLDLMIRHNKYNEINKMN